MPSGNVGIDWLFIVLLYVTVDDIPVIFMIFLMLRRSEEVLTGQAPLPYLRHLIGIF